MRLSSVLTILCCVAALILSFLCLFAGSKRTFLQNGDLLTLNMSRLGYGAGNIFNTTDGDGGFLDNLINDAQGAINNLLNGAAEDIANKLNISDFYSVHIMDYCKGTFEPNATLAAVNGSHVSKNTTYCSANNALFHFNVTEVVQSALPHSVNLSDISWPKAVTDAQNAVRVASMATVVLYIIGITLTGLAFLCAIFGFVTNGRLSACLNVIIDMLAFIALTAASAVATSIIVKIVNVFNKYGKEIGVSATKGSLFLGMTWAAVALVFIATIVSIFQLVVGRRNGGGSYVTQMREKR